MICLPHQDGVEGAEGVVVVAATNRLDMIDAALTRPGLCVSVYCHAACSFRRLCGSFLLSR